MTATLRFPRHTEGAWVRTCQECGHTQTDNPPAIIGQASPAYCDRQCKRCRSTAMDYGQQNMADEEWVD